MQENKILVWKTQEGNLVRLTHMSSEHLRNAISWLLREQNLDPNWRGDGWSDLSDTYEGVQLGVWIIVNVVAVTLWIQTAMHHETQGWAVLAMWVTFLLNSIYGAYKWRKEQTVGEVK